MIEKYSVHSALEDKFEYGVRAVEAFDKSKDMFLFNKLSDSEKMDLLSAIVKVSVSLNKTAISYVENNDITRIKKQIDEITTQKHNDIERISNEVEAILSRDYSEQLRVGFDSEELNKQLADIVMTLLSKYDISDEAKESILQDKIGFGPISKYMDFRRDDVEEIQINSFNDIICIIGGRPISVEEAFESPRHLELFMQKIINRSGKIQKTVEGISDSNPFTRIRLGESTRVSIMGGGIVGRPIPLQNSLNEVEKKVPEINICIRKQKSTPITTEQMLNWGSVGHYELALLKACIGHNVSTMGFGVTGSGKTAMFRAIIVDCVPSDLRIITVAETDEMQLRVLDTEEYLMYDDYYLNDDNEQCVRRVHELDEKGNKIKNPNYLKPKINALMWEIPSKDTKIMGKPGFLGAVNASLTFTPEMIIFQETKGAEIKDLIEEAISGHQVLTTIHVKEAKYVPIRVLLMYQQADVSISDDKILEQVPAAFPLLVEFKRFKDGTRKIAAISELTGFNERGKPDIRPLSKFKVEKNIIDENGKKKVIGKFVAICNPLDIRKGTLYNIMKDSFLTEAEEQNLMTLYETYKDEEEIKLYEDSLIT